MSNDKKISTKGIISAVVILTAGIVFALSFTRRQVPPTYQKNPLQLEEITFGAVSSPSEIDISGILTNYVDAQKTEVDTRGKYKRLPNVESNIGGQVVTSKTDEYISPDGSKGYAVTFYATIGNKRYIKVIGYGSEAVERTKDWFESKIQL